MWQTILSSLGYESSTLCSAFMEGSLQEVSDENNPDVPGQPSGKLELTFDP